MFQLLGALALMVAAARGWQALRTRRQLARARPGEWAAWRVHGVLWRVRVGAARGGGTDRGTVTSGAGPTPAGATLDVEVDGPLCPRPGCGARLFEIGGKVLECPQDHSRYAKPPSGRGWLDLRERVRRDAARQYGSRPPRCGSTNSGETSPGD